MSGVTAACHPRDPEGVTSHYLRHLCVKKLRSVWMESLSEVAAHITRTCTRLSQQPCFGVDVSSPEVSFEQSNCSNRIAKMVFRTVYLGYGLVGRGRSELGA